MDSGGPTAAAAWWCLVAAACAPWWCWRWPTVTADRPLDLVLVHANDMHSRFDETDAYCNECREDDAARGLCYGGFGRVAQYVKDARTEAAGRGVPSLFMVAGDTFQGTPYFTFFDYVPVVEFINRLRPDVMTLGNHEFDHGVDTTVLYLKGIQGIPTVVSNLNMTSEPNLDKFVLPSYVFTLNNTKVGIVGYLTPDTPTLSNTGDVGFYDEIESLKKETKKLRDSGVNIIIGLGHSGIDRDQEIAREVDDIDLIVGGHSHTFIYTGTPPSIEKPYGPYPVLVTNRKNKVVPVLQAYANTKYIGKIDLKFDSNGDLIRFNGTPTLLDHEVKKDPLMLIEVDKWKPNVTSRSNVTIGRTTVELINECRNNECNIGNLIADSFVYYNMLNKKVYDENWTDAPIALTQAGSIRTTINETDHDGYITLGQLINVMPFTNNLVKITVSGSTILEAFEHSVSDYVMNSGGPTFLQVSGVQVEFDLKQNPGHRVSSLFLRCGHCSIPKFEPLVLTANYTIVMSNFLAKGGNNFTAFKKILKKNELLGVEDQNATATYINHISPVMTGIEGRINFKNNVHEKSGAQSIFTQNSQLLIVYFIILLLCHTRASAEICQGGGKVF